MHKAIIFRWILISFLAGIALASFVSVPTVGMWFGVAIGGLACIIGRRGLVVGLSLFTLVYGMYLTTGALDDNTPLYRVVGQSVTISGYVDGDFQVTKSGGQFPLRVGTEDVLISQAAWPQWRYGQALQVTGIVSLPQNLDDFDYVAYLRMKGIRTIMRSPDVQETDALLLSPLRRVWIATRSDLYHVRDAISGLLQRSVSEPSASYLAGILTGQRQSITQDIKDAFARTGTSHILAISGYNITIVAQVIMLGLLRVMPRRRALPWALAGILVFTLLVGAGSSVVRAAIMGSLLLVAGNIGRLSSAENAILLSGAMMCLHNPLVLRSDVGFQLSFVAIIGLVYLEPLMQPIVGRVVRNTTLASMAATTMAAQLATLPLLLYEFGNLSVYALPANLLVLPLVPLAMALGLATAVAGLLVPLAGHIVGVVAWLVASYQLSVIRWFAHLPLSDLSWHIDAGTMVALYVVVVCGYIYYAKPSTTITHTT